MEQLPTVQLLTTQLHSIKANHRSHWKGERHGIYIRVPKALHAALQAKARTQNKLFNDVATGALAHGLQVNIG